MTINGIDIKHIDLTSLVYRERKQQRCFTSSHPTPNCRALARLIILPGFISSGYRLNSNAVLCFHIFYYHIWVQFMFISKFLFTFNSTFFVILFCYLLQEYKNSVLLAILFIKLRTFPNVGSLIHMVYPVAFKQIITPGLLSNTA